MCQPACRPALHHPSPAPTRRCRGPPRRIGKLRTKYVPQLLLPPERLCGIPEHDCNCRPRVRPAKSFISVEGVALTEINAVNSQSSTVRLGFLDRTTHAP